uniref:Uncharacterized protein n=1 Tax=Oryza glumipatula TaxID=40148 RepID=A0A0E0A2K1_9ORYZ
MAARRSTLLPRGCLYPSNSEVAREQWCPMLGAALLSSVKLPLGPRWAHRLGNTRKLKEIIWTGDPEDHKKNLYVLTTLIVIFPVDKSTHWFWSH